VPPENRIWRSGLVDAVRPFGARAALRGVIAEIILSVKDCRKRMNAGGE
jgi:hypothetical protein